MRTAIDLHAPEVWSDPRLTEQIATSTAALSARYYRTRITEAVVLHTAHLLTGKKLYQQRLLQLRDSRAGRLPSFVSPGVG